MTGENHISLSNKDISVGISLRQERGLVVVCTEYEDVSHSEVCVFKLEAIYPNQLTFEQVIIFLACKSGLGNRYIRVRLLSHENSTKTTQHASRPSVYFTMRDRIGKTSGARKQLRTTTITRTVDRSPRQTRRPRQLMSARQTLHPGHTKPQPQPKSKPLLLRHESQIFSRNYIPRKASARW